MAKTNNEPKEGDVQQPKEGEQTSAPQEQKPAAPAAAEEKSEPQYEKTMDLRWKVKNIPLKDGGIRQANVLQQKHKNLDPEGTDRWYDIPMNVE